MALVAKEEEGLTDPRSHGPCIRRRRKLSSSGFFPPENRRGDDICGHDCGCGDVLCGCFVVVVMEGNENLRWQRLLREIFVDETS